MWLHTSPAGPRNWGTVVSVCYKEWRVVLWATSSAAVRLALTELPTPGLCWHFGKHRGWQLWARTGGTGSGSCQAGAGSPVLCPGPGAPPAVLPSCRGGYRVLGPQSERPKAPSPPCLLGPLPSCQDPQDDGSHLSSWWVLQRPSGWLFPLRGTTVPSSPPSEKGPGPPLSCPRPCSVTCWASIPGSHCEGEEPPTHPRSCFFPQCSPTANRSPLPFMSLDIRRPPRVSPSPTVQES